MSKVLLLEDDREVGESIVSFLKIQKFIVEWVFTGEEALSRLEIFEYDLAIFDWVLEGMDGRSTCESYRKTGGLVPILMLTGKSAMNDKLSGFEAGADDYLVKPFGAQELLARMRSILKRPKALISTVLEVGELRLDTDSAILYKGASEIRLMPKEFIVLEFLMRHRNRVFSAGELLSRIWSAESESTEIAVRKCLTRLRSKIDGDEKNGHLVTVKGLGYKITAPKK